jgi:uncharacterized protein (TIGR03437 family)
MRQAGGFLFPPLNHPADQISSNAFRPGRRSFTTAYFKKKTRRRHKPMKTVLVVSVLLLRLPFAAKAQNSQASFGPVSVPATSVIFDPDSVLTSTQLAALGKNGTPTPAVKALSFTASPGQVITFAASGTVGNSATGSSGPDGFTLAVDITSLGSISGFVAPVGFPLVGVFTNGAPSGTAPGSYNYTSGVSQPSYAPALNQVFFIGDGLTGTGSGSLQTFTVPATATELWLGFADAGGFDGPAGTYGDNTGSLTVTGTLSNGPSCASIIQNAVTVSAGGALSTNGLPTSMLATFAPKGMTLAVAANACGFSGFNWQQWVDTLPAPNPFNCQNPALCGFSPSTSITAPPRFLDPINGGYSTNPNQSAGRYPFYYSDTNLASNCNQIGASCTAIETGTSLNFADAPTDNQLPSGSFMVFTTALVGVLPCVSPCSSGAGIPGPVLYSWDWLSSFNGTANGVSRIGNFTVAPDTGSGGGGVNILSVNGTPVITGPVIFVNGAVNAGSYAPDSALAPGSIAAVFGSFPVNGSASATTLPLPTGLDGLSIQFGGVPARFFFASSGQANIQIPWEVAGQTQSAVTVTVGGQTSIPQAVAITPFAPSIFSTNGEGTGQGSIQDASYRLVDASNPAAPNSAIVIYCTGLGAVTNTPPDGSPALGSPLSQTTTTPTVTIGGLNAPVAFSGLVPSLTGLYQVNAQVPATIAADPAAPVIITIGGAVSNTVTIAVSGQ